MNASQHRLAVEIGGTFTDVILLESRGNEQPGARVLKLFSTPEAPERAFLAAVDQLNLDGRTVSEVLHGSTVATNAVLERKGVTTALITTEGFRDLLEIQRGDKENIYDIFYQRPSPLVSREWVFTVRERMLADGSVLQPLDTDQVREIAARLQGSSIQAVAICLLHSYANPTHELRVKEIIEEALPDTLVLTSAEILPQFREYERASTTVMSAYIAPKMVHYIENLQNQLAARSFSQQFLITQSNGGVIPVPALRREVVRTLLSGPAAGVTGAIAVARQVGIDNIITLDMGGTSTDVCLVNQGKPLVTTENKLNGLPIAVPMIDIVTVGAGGGSLAWLDEGGMLRVGPHSAGASPGPAAYGRGGQEPTVTDAHVYRGLLRPNHFVGGAYQLDREACSQAMKRLADRTAITPHEAAEAITTIVNANMIQAIRVVSTQRGYDPRSYTLVAFGGAGALHAAKLAEELGMERVLVPRYAGLLSAFGLLVADTIRDYVQTRVSATNTTNPSEIQAEIARLQERAYAEFESYGIPRERIYFFPSCDMRYQGQAFELQIPLSVEAADSTEIAGRFHEAHRQRYGFASPHEPTEIVNYRLQAVISRSTGEWAVDWAQARTGAAMVSAEEASLLLDGNWHTCRFLERATLPTGYSITGPAIIEEETSTCYVPDGWSATVLEGGHLLIEREGHQ